MCGSPEYLLISKTIAASSVGWAESSLSSQSKKNGKSIDAWQLSADQKRVGRQKCSDMAVLKIKTIYCQKEREINKMKTAG